MSICRRKDNQVRNALTYLFRPVSVGGLAGGTKYIVQGILFKFAKDTPVGDGWMYGGDSPSDEKAIKAASHEVILFFFLFSVQRNFKLL